MAKRHGLLAARMTNRDPAEIKKNDGPEYLNEDQDKYRSRDELARVNKKRKQAKLKSILTQGIAIVLCVYMIFLIYGLACTNYVASPQGGLKPEILSIEELRVLKEYNLVASYYMRSRILYEEILSLDYRLAIAPEESLTLAMNYTKLLEVVDKIAVDLKGAEYDSMYTALYSQLFDWTATECGLYLQKIAIALTNNDQQAAGEAIILRDAMMKDYATITANIATLAQGTRGADAAAICNWSPEDYFQGLQEKEE